MRRRFAQVKNGVTHNCTVQLITRINVAQPGRPEKWLVRVMCAAGKCVNNWETGMWYSMRLDRLELL